MKRKILACVVLFFGLAVCVRIYQINVLQYPQPQTEVVGKNEVLRLDDFDVTLVAWEWKDSGILKEIAPGYSIMMDENGEDYPEEKMKVAFATLKITKTTDHDAVFSLEKAALESEGWKNQWDAILYETLNGADGMNIHLDVGESRNIVIPVDVYDFQFHKKDWEDVTKSQFSIVFQNYPVKRMIHNE